MIGYGRVPAKKALRIPIGLALTYGSMFMSAASASQANRLAAQGLVTWINMPTLPKPTRQYANPIVMIDQTSAPAEPMVAIDTEAVNAWEAHQGQDDRF